MPPPIPKWSRLHFIIFVEKNLQSLWIVPVSSLTGRNSCLEQFIRRMQQISVINSFPICSKLTQKALLTWPFLEKLKRKPCRKWTELSKFYSNLTVPSIVWNVRGMHCKMLFNWYLSCSRSDTWKGTQYYLCFEPGWMFAFMYILSHRHSKAFKEPLDIRNHFSVHVDASKTWCNW